MNSCVLMAQIIQAPELRYTSDTQTPIAQMLVEFPALKADEPPATLKVVGWGNFAQEIKDMYSVGDLVAIEGRLSMNTIERPEGFKEKRAELVASRMYKLGVDTEIVPEIPATSGSVNSSTPATTTRSSNVVVPMRSRKESEPSPKGRDYPHSVADPRFDTVQPSTFGGSDNQQDLDDIPF
ncbi:single-stranded DNA-binding protein [Limnofasciculus baicalensis]|uniref:Single-stranded DNA-binding protein n=1 Tax=Limnofasciculus baicalensis BBK-W-15 TaxID=2699891 RepID=A0AAE3KP99_9CYAN|nr:single-stranded DNA-binding protein [Limnofasciculus baicalensis]MCP2731340.1 single-stranded DNA-binding protein [Limnofasciculus baicalensis BBK-W-15]